MILPTNCIPRGPPWAITGLPAALSGVCVSLPNCELPALRVVGGAKFARFKILKTSQRNWNLNRSVIRVVLFRFKSHWAKPGPRKLLRPQAPIVLSGTVAANARALATRSEEHTSELQSPCNLVCRLLLEK